MQMMARFPVQQQALTVSIESELLPQVNFLEQYWQMGHEPAS